MLKFNLKPSSGLAYLEARGHLKHEPADVAQFLHQHVDKLDKTVIGDYLGKEKEYQDGFCVKVRGPRQAGRGDEGQAGQVARSVGQSTGRS